MVWLIKQIGWKCDTHFDWGDASAYLAGMFVWGRDERKMSELYRERPKRLFPYRLFMWLFPRRKQVNQRRNAAGEEDVGVVGYC
jgi:hypothetical protein